MLPVAPSIQRVLHVYPLPSLLNKFFDRMISSSLSARTFPVLPSVLSEAGWQEHTNLALKLIPTY